MTRGSAVHTASELAARLRSGDLETRDVIEDVLRRIGAAADLNAFITVDADGARRAAAEADARRRRGAAVGPLHGVPVVAKDNIHVRGLPCTAGTPALRELVPQESAPVVEALVRAGAIVVGKTNMDELTVGVLGDNAAYGRICSPYDRRRVGGGLSGGTAVAIAARIVPAGLGTDACGSVRIPAALNGVVGFRPSQGRYSQDGINLHAHTTETAGPIARSVADVELLDAIILGNAGPSVAADRRRVRLGVARNPCFDDLDPEVRRLTEEALDRLRGAGIALVDVALPDLLPLNRRVTFVRLFEANADLGRYLAKYLPSSTVADVVEQIASPYVRWLFDVHVFGEGSITEAAYLEAVTEGRTNLQRFYADVFATHRIDALVFPTTPLPAPPIGTGPELELGGKIVRTALAFLRNTDPGSDAGLPGITLPMAMTADGLPLGLALDAPAGHDHELLAIASLIEEIFGRLPAPPT